MCVCVCVCVNNYDFLFGAFSYIFLRLHFIPCSSVYELRQICHGSRFVIVT